MTDLAEMMEQRWPSEQPGDVARHFRGLLLITQKKREEAIDALAKVSPAYSSLIYVKFSLAGAAFQVSQDRAAQAKAEPDKAKKEQFTKDAARYDSLAVEALKATPPLPPGADSRTTVIWLQGKIELGNAYNRAKQYDDIDRLVDPLLADIKKGGLKVDKPERLEEARASLVQLKLLGKYGAANAEFAAGHFAKVKEIADPLVTAILKGEYPELKKNPALRWGLMNLALRVSVQEGNTARAREIIEALQKFAKDEGDEGGGKAILMQLAVTIKEQVREVRKKKNDELLKKTVENFGTLLDAVAKGEKAPAPEFLRLMAEAYAALGKHDKAVELARQVTEPKGDDAKDDKKVGNWRFCRILVVKELRLDGKVDEAKAELAKIKETPWGKEHPEAVKEGFHLDAAGGAPGRAYTGWEKLVDQLAKKIQMPGVKDQYFECYFYMTECLYKYAQSPNGAKNRDRDVKRAAGFIVNLEKNWPDLGGEESKARFDDLLERESPLKEQYDKLKAGSK
jgi:tetratricopeptide (TPR) repeat protein